ncbi:MAG: hypothetical protein ACRCTL_13115 [Pseudomonas sp.]
MPPIVRGALGAAVLALAGCAQQPGIDAPVTGPVAAQTHSDPQRCATQAECTTKTARTLLFVFDYAAAGGALVQRQERLLFTPADAPRGEWPAIYIRLAEPMAGHFDFNAECQAQSCRYRAVQLLQVYRDYLDGKPGALARP